MDGKEYLQQISASARPVKKKKAGFFGSAFFKVILGGLVALAVVLILGGILSAGGGMQDKATRLKLHIDSTLSVMETYQGSVKSSDLRSSSASLRSVLSNTSRELGEYLTEKYNYSEKKISKSLTEEAKLEEDALSASLLTARSNGVLDSVYANKMAYEIFTLKAAELEIYDKAGDEKLKSIIGTSYNSLDNLYSSFNDFSDKK